MLSCVDMVCKGHSCTAHLFSLLTLNSIFCSIQDQITSMIMAGTKHFKANLVQVGDKDNEECIYKALRLYNSGSMNEGNLSNGKKRCW